MSGQAIINITLFIPSGFDCMTEDDLSKSAHEIRANIQKIMDHDFPTVEAEVRSVWIER